jgi:hypothetical protein
METYTVYVRQATVLTVNCISATYEKMGPGSQLAPRASRASANNDDPERRQAFISHYHDTAEPHPGDWQ